MPDFSCREGLNGWRAPGGDLALVDDVVSITIEGSCVIIESPGPLDAIRTSVVVDAMNAAVSAGLIVVVGAEQGVTRLSSPIGSVRHADDAEPIEPHARRAGVVVVPSDGLTWMIDVAGARFLRSDRLLDLRFVSASAWSSFCELLITADSISARVADGEYVTGRRSSGLSAGGDLRTSPIGRVAS